MSKKLLRKKLALMLATLKKKRKYYCECEYLESTGTQYIDTGIKIDDTCGYDISWMALNSDDRIILGTKGSDDSRWVLSGNNNPFLNMSWNSVFTTDCLGLNKIQTAQMNYLNDRKRLLNGIEKTPITETLSSSANTYNVGIFAGYWGSSTVSLYSTCRIYYAKITKGTETIRDFIPVLDWDMTPCMYDKVTEQLFYNAGTGNFVAGREIHPVEYLESTGEQYIDTGVKQDKLNIQTKFKMSNSDASTYGFVLGARYSYNNSVFLVLGRNSSDSHLFEYGDNTNCIIENPYQKDIILSNEGNVVNVNGTTKTLSTKSFSSAYNVFLFACNENNSAILRTQHKTKMYYCKMVYNGVLVRDFIPAIDSEGRGFMFDRVSHTCYLNQGTGAFKYPAREVEYLESTGTQYIDTGIYGTEDLDTELVCQQLQRNASLSGKGIFGAFATTNANSYYLYQQGDAISHWQLGFGSYLNTSAEIDLNKHTFNFSNYKVYMDGIEIASLTAGSMNTTPYTLLLFNTHRNNGTLYDALPQRFYGVKFVKSGVLIGNFIPVFKDGQAGMLDKANNVFYSNVGTGTFVVGRIIEPEYE